MCCPEVGWEDIYKELESEMLRWDMEKEQLNGG